MSESEFLLEWLNQQRRALGLGETAYSLEHVYVEGTMTQILHKINPKVFLEPVTDIHKLPMEEFEQHLEKMLGKRMKRSFKLALSSSASGIQAAKLLCYLSIQCADKTEYINRIFQLSGQTQTFLMQQLQMMDSNLENIMEVRQILELVENLEEENEELRKKIQAMSQSHQKLYEFVKEIEDESTAAKNEAHSYRLEKDEIIQVLKIQSMADYVSMYQCVKSKNKSLQQTIKDLEDELEKYQNHCKVLQNRVAADCEVITHLNDDVNRYKYLYSEAKEMTCFTELSSSKKSVVKSRYQSNKENQLQEECRPFMKSLEIEKSDIAFRNRFCQIDVNNIGDYKAEFQNEQLLVKLKEMSEQNELLQTENKALRDKTQLLNKQNGFYKSTIGSVIKTQNKFVQNYRQLSKNKKF